MPQMAPLSWLALFLVFTSTLLLFTFINYFSFLVGPPKTQDEIKISTNPMNWKW
nr:ATP synthase F0 subunit 8 [Claassenia sp. 2 YNX-2023a]